MLNLNMQIYQLWIWSSNGFDIKSTKRSDAQGIFKEVQYPIVAKRNVRLELKTAIRIRRSKHSTSTKTWIPDRDNTVILKQLWLNGQKLSNIWGMQKVLPAEN